MKRIISALVIIFLLILTAAVFIKPVILFIAKKQLENVFVQSEVSIEKCAIKPMSKLSLLNIKIKNGKLYDFRIKEAVFSYKLLSMMRGNIAKFHLKDVSADIDLGEKNIQDLSSNLNIGSQGIFLINNLKLEKLNLNLKSKELSLICEVSIELNLQTLLPDYLDIKIDSWESNSFRLNKAFLKIDRILHAGSVFVKNIQYDKLKINEIKSSAELNAGILSLTSFEAEILGGGVGGNIELAMDKSLKYSANLKFIGLDMEKFVKDFDLGKKFQLTGSLNGLVMLKGSGYNINILKGDFSTTVQGGVLIIEDNTFLENLAKNSGQSLDILVENFRNYHYNTGMMKLFFDKGNLVFDIALEGEAGKRKLNIIVHNFELKMEGL